MKILYVTTVGDMMKFFKSFVMELLEKGHTVDVACNEEELKCPDYVRELGLKVHHLSCNRKPFNKGTLKAIKEIRKLVEENNYDIVHCHSPIASICTRLACRKLRKKTGVKVVYTAHGFHFYKGAPKKNWLIYYTAEKFCAKYTDLLITINDEDYNIAKNKFKAKKVAYVPGVGIDVEKFVNAVVDVKEKRKELGIPDDAFVLISVGELNENKNHQVVIKALAELKNSKIHYVIAGVGYLKDYLLELSTNLCVNGQLHLLGYRSDVAEIFKCSDVCVFPSIREGLGLGAIEGMIAGLPIIVANNRGTRAYSVNNHNAFVCDYNDVKAFACSIDKLYNDKELCAKMGQINKEKAKQYEVKEINKKMHELYGSL